MSNDEAGLHQPPPARRQFRWNGGRRETCRLCGDPTFLLDPSGTPCHKVCGDAEQEPR